MKKINIIVPVYNTKEEYLRKCLESLENQTIQKDIEIIIIDDGSKIECAKICDEYSKKYENIETIHQKNQGLGTSRNNGMKIAKGEWLLFVDSDDWVENNICEKLLEAAKDDIDIIISSCNKCYKDKIKPIKMFGGKDREFGKDKEKLELQIISKYVLGKDGYNALYLMTAWAKLYRRSFMEKNGLNNFCNLKFREDNIFNLHCFEKARKIVYKDGCLYNYRQCKTSLMHKNNWDMIGEYIKYLEEKKKFIIKYNKPPIFHEAFKIRIIQSIIIIIGQYIFKRNCKFSEKINKINEIVERQDFKDAIQNVEKSYLNWYLNFMVFLLRKKMYWMVNVIYNLREFIKERDKRNLYE